VFYGAVTTLTGDDSLELQSVETRDGLLLIRLRDARTVSGPHGTEIAEAVRPGWTLVDSDGTRIDALQTSSGSGPFSGVVDIAFATGSDHQLHGELQLTSPARTITFTT
jgi:hypothetical protein